MNAHKSDCIVLGAGVVGLAAALLASQKGLSVAVIDQKSSPTFDVSMPLQARTLALNHATLAMLDRCHVWPFIDKKRLGFMDAMRIVDEQGGACTLQSPNKAETLSVVFEYAHLAFALYLACLQSPVIDLYFNHVIESVSFDKQQVTIKLNSDHYLEAQVIVGADGADSWLSSYLHLPLIKKDYHHSACVGLATSEKGLFNKALQTCGEDFILGILPLNNSHWHSIIFSCDEEKKIQLLQSDLTEQNDILTQAALHELGSMQWQTPIVSIPLIRQHLQTYVAPRVVIIGDAAHRIHPLAGQGANMGFSDAIVLMDCLGEAKINHQDIGSVRVLKQYELKQKPKNNAWLMMHDALKKALTDASMLGHMSRQLGFKLGDQNAWLTRILKKVVG
jgi:2-octaprenylphenol hydroxylase